MFVTINVVILEGDASGGEDSRVSLRGRIHRLSHDHHLVTFSPKPLNSSDTPASVLNNCMPGMAVALKTNISFVSRRLALRAKSRGVQPSPRA